MASLSKGAVGELLAARYLRKHKYTLLAANYRTRFGEIDIIAANRKYIAFVEVKQRNSTAISTPQEAVTVEKQQKILRTAALYLQNHPTKLQPRFDVISVVMDDGEDPLAYKSITHFPAAFEAENGL